MPIPSDPAAEFSAIPAGPDAALYIFDVLSALRRLSLREREAFLAYLIEMAAGEAARLAGGREQPAE